MKRQFPDKYPEEKLVLCFDFSAELESDETLTSNPVVTYGVHLGVDATISLMQNGSAVFDATARKVLVPIKGGLDGCDYLVKVAVATTNSLKYLAMAAVLPVRDL